MLAERGIILQGLLPHGLRFTFNGLGWDFAERHFKLYLLVADLGELRATWPNLFGAAAHGARPEGLLSFTFVEDQVFERKIYFYPDEEPAAHGATVVSQARMSTSRRGTVDQLNVRDAVPWRARLGAAGRRILDRYQAADLRLDTVAFEGEERCTLYFP